MDTNNAKVQTTEYEYLEDKKVQCGSGNEEINVKRERENRSSSSHKIRGARRTSSGRSVQQSHGAASRSRSRSPALMRSTRRGRTPNPFMNFLQDFRQDYDGWKSSVVSQLAGKEWKGMSSKEKKPYVEAANRIREQQKHQNKKHGSDSQSNQTKSKPTAKKTDDPGTDRKDNKNENQKHKKKPQDEDDSSLDTESESVTSGTVGSAASEGGSDSSS